MTALGLAAHGSHRKPPWYQRALTRIRSARDSRRQRKTGVILDSVQHDAFMVRVEAHVPPPQAVAQARVTALFGALHHEHAGFGQPPAAVLPDADEPRPWELETGQFPKIIDALGRQ